MLPPGSLEPQDPQILQIPGSQFPQIPGSPGSPGSPRSPEPLAPLPSPSACRRPGPAGPADTLSASCGCCGTPASPAPDASPPAGAMEAITGASHQQGSHHCRITVPQGFHHWSIPSAGIPSPWDPVTGVSHHPGTPTLEYPTTLGSYHPLLGSLCCCGTTMELLMDAAPTGGAHGHPGVAPREPHLQQIFAQHLGLLCSARQEGTGDIGEGYGAHSSTPHTPWSLGCAFPLGSRISAPTSHSPIS